MRASEISQIVGGEVIGNPDLEVERLRGIEEAERGDISFIANPKYSRYHESTEAALLLIDPETARRREDLTYVVVADPYRAFVKLLRHLAPPLPTPPAGIDPSAVIAESARIAESASIGPLVVIGAEVVIGERTVIRAGTVIEEGARVGEECRIGPNVTIGWKCGIGDRCVLHPGVVIGADGFGFAPRPEGGWEKVPQTGNVVIGDDVEIGANCTIDRATLGTTTIESCVKLDNLVHVAHNVVIGAGTAIAAQAGISGSTRIGRRNMLAGQVGVVGHIETADDVIIEAQSGVSKSVRNPGRYFGHPAKEHSLALRQEGALRQLPDLLAEVRELRHRLNRLESSLHDDADGE